MKMWILATAMLIGLTASAQEFEKREKREPLTPEQKTELHVKRMTLELDLNESQQKEVKKLLLAESKKRVQLKEQRRANREEGKKLSNDELYAMKSKRLDNQIAMKKEMKKILTPEQFEKFEQMKKENREKITKRAKKIKKHRKW